MWLIQSLERCYNVDATLSRLARTYQDAKFLRAKASALGFASLKSKGPQVGPSRLNSSRDEDDDDDPYAHDDKDDYDEEDEEDADDDNVDLDVLPTMLVYRNGDLVHNWVRVDWEAGEAGLEEFLTKSAGLPRSQLSFLLTPADIIFFRSPLVQRRILASRATTTMTLISCGMIAMTTWTCRIFFDQTCSGSHPHRNLFRAIYEHYHVCKTTIY